MDNASAQVNEFGQPVGPAVPGWTPRSLLPETPMAGCFCTVRPVDFAADPAALFEALAPAGPPHWTYVPIGPFEDAAGLEGFLRDFNEHGQVFVITVQGRPVGASSYVQHKFADGSVEIGGVIFAPSLQRTPAATEAMHLMMKRVFDAGYRRYEWKCHALNAASRAAAERLGFTFEGVFRNATVQKGRSRDTAWFSVTDAEWPRLAAAFSAWLDPANFDADGRQKSSLASFRES